MARWEEMEERIQFRFYSSVYPLTARTQTTSPLFYHRQYSSLLSVDEILQYLNFVSNIKQNALLVRKSCWRTNIGTQFVLHSGESLFSLVDFNVLLIRHLQNCLRVHIHWTVLKCFFLYSQLTWIVVIFWCCLFHRWESDFIRHLIILLIYVALLSL